jgi:xylulokinase
MPASLVIGIDSSTTATKAIAWDREGRLVAEGRAAIPLANPGPGLFEQNPADWWASTAAALRALCGQIDTGAVAAVSISNQRETFAPVDENGEAVRPGLVWLDERCTPMVKRFSKDFGARRLHRLCGKPADVTPVIYRLAWMREHEPANFRRTAHFVDVHGHIARHLTGEKATSIASADPHAIIDMKKGRHSRAILKAVGLAPERFYALHRPGAVLGEVTGQAAGETGLKAGTRVVAGGGDGQCAGTGVNVLEKGRAYLNLGTAVVSGMYAKDYVTDPAFRTMGAVAEAGCLPEYCLRTGTFLVDWLITRVFGVDPRQDPGIYARLEAEAAAAPIGSGGLLLPYWSGTMSPWWNPEARGTMLGLAPWQGQGHVYRALLEGIACDVVSTIGKMEKAADLPVDHFVAIGGGASSRLWRQIIADVADRPVRVLDTVEASSLGAGVAAAVGAGWFGGFREGAAAMAGRVVSETAPIPANVRRYAELRAIYDDAWPAVARLTTRLSRFMAEAS